MKRILDYEEEAEYDNDFAHFLFVLNDGVLEPVNPTGALCHLLEIDGQNWRGRLHIIVEVEDSDPHP